MSRDLFYETKGIYLLSHSVGLMPKSTGDAIEEKYLQTWQQSDNTIWTEWLGEIEHFRAAVAILLNAKSADICPQINLSSSLSKILPALPQNGKKTFLLSEDDFPSLAYVIEVMGRKEYSIKYIPSGTDLNDLDIWDTYLTQDVHTVLLTHVQSNTGKRNPINQITALTREKNIYSIVDVAQSAGVIPINILQWQADFILGSCVKWLCGGPGAGFLWVNPALLSQLEPTDVGWFSHEDPFEFDIFNFRYAQDALRFWGGTPSVVPYIVAANSINTLIDIGIENIFQYNVLCKQHLFDDLPKGFFLSPTDIDLQGGTLVIKNDKSIAQRFDDNNIKFDQRDEGLRLSPHIYNTLEEIAAVKDILRSP